MLTKITIGGVPEHFNLPIHLAIENNLFKNKGIDLVWTDFSGGTGEMAQALRNNDIDMSVLLTEGITLDIINGNPSRIISEYVTTPLCWGVQTSRENELESHNQIYDKKYAISRSGSGSHLMAIIDANGKNIHLTHSQFEVINNLQGALNSLKNLETDVFYWEKFTTKPYVDAGLLKRIGEFPTPWPSFVIALTNKMIDKSPQHIKTILSIIHESCIYFMDNAEKMIPLVAQRYSLNYVDAENWYHRTAWATNGWVSDKMLESVIYNLKLAEIIPQNKAIPELIWEK